MVPCNQAGLWKQDHCWSWGSYVAAGTSTVMHLSGLQLCGAFRILIICRLLQDHTSDASPHHIIPFELAPGASLAALSAMLQQKTGIAPHAQRLLFAGEKLVDASCSLTDLNLQDGDMLDLCKEQLGGNTGPQAFAAVSNEGTLWP